MQVQPHLKTAISVMSVLMISIPVSSVYGISLIFAFLCGIIPVLLLGFNQGLTFRIMLKSTLLALWRIRGLFAIITLMGMSIAMWISSGAVAFLMQAGSVLSQGVLFLPVAFIICALSSVCIGTALGTFSTIGLAFYGMGKSVGIPDAIVVGTLVSGVFLADRIAPMSGLVNLTLKRTGLRYADYFKSSWRRVLLAVMVCSVAYGVVGFLTPQSPLSGSESVLGDITAAFRQSKLLWLLPVLTFGLAIRGISTVWTLLSGVLTGFGFTVLLQKRPLGEALMCLVNGYSDKLGVLKGGGVMGIAEVLGIVALAVVYNELLSTTGITRTLLHHLAEGVGSMKALKRRMGLFSIALTSLTCDQTVGILLPLEAMKPFHKDEQISSMEAAILVSDTGTLIAPLEFWNVNALVIMALTGIPAWQYGPWAVFCWLMPVMALICPPNVRKSKNSDIMRSKLIDKEDALE